MAAVKSPLTADIDDVEQSRSYTSRRTRAGTNFYYELAVLQQPERARACGAGQKSAADRRPVDPPPVVQLRVLEGPSREEAKDITMNYTANFFLFAELDPVRPMAHGRVHPPSSLTPVLTGMPVSGMAYLDRPTEAGYFLFPDLSVRHEGRYVLSFHLYEDIKKVEDRDYDSDPADDMNPAFEYRMAVKSMSFSVYSAKKFPGLTESTMLSKTISDQGCRVRIRRDVRMRRREGKPAVNDSESNVDEFSNSRRTQTPDVRDIRPNADQYRARSSSNGGEQRNAYAPIPDRRPSVAESFPAPPPPPPPPRTYGAGPSISNVHLRFGSDAPGAPYAPHQHIHTVAQPPVSPTIASYHSNQPSPYQAAPPSFTYSSRTSSQYAPSNPPSTPHDMLDRRPSVMAVPPSPSNYPARDIDAARREADLRRESIQSHPPLPPMSDVQSRLPPMQLPSLSTIDIPSSNAVSRGDIIEAAPLIPLPAPEYESARAGMKRGYGDTFVENNRPLCDHQRPQDNHRPSGYMSNMYMAKDDPEYKLYKRADGSIRKPHQGFF